MVQVLLALPQVWISQLIVFGFWFVFVFQSLALEPLVIRFVFAVYLVIEMILLFQPAFLAEVYFPPLHVCWLAVSARIVDRPQSL